MATAGAAAQEDHQAAAVEVAPRQKHRQRGAGDDHHAAPALGGGPTGAGHPAPRKVRELRLRPQPRQPVLEQRVVQAQLLQRLPVLLRADQPAREGAPRAARALPGELLSRVRGRHEAGRLRRAAVVQQQQPAAGAGEALPPSGAGGPARLRQRLRRPRARLRVGLLQGAPGKH